MSNTLDLAVYGKWRCAISDPPALNGKEYEVALGVECIVCMEDGRVTAMRYCANLWAKTERGRLPRWEDNGRLAYKKVMFWMDFPSAPPSIEAREAA
ncbi:MAG: hypothetical protein ACRCWJ_05960 [Casimicrobium sp.]